MSDQEEQFIRGFNNGYLLEKFEPTLLATVLKGLSPTTDYVDGLVSGKEECELEKSQKEMEDLQHLRNNALSRGLDLEKE